MERPRLPIPAGSGRRNKEIPIMKAKLKLWTGWDSVRRLVRKFTVEDRLKRIADAHGPETEVMLYLWPDDTGDDASVFLHVGNPTSCVMLGEVHGEQVFEGRTVSAAITAAEKFYFPNARAVTPGANEKPVK